MNVMPLLLQLVGPHLYKQITIYLGRLAEQATDETTENIPRYTNYIRTLLPGKDPTLTASAANAFARLILSAMGTPLAEELVDYNTRFYLNCR